ncbi:MAG: hypothetical protein IJW63_05510 [Lachnospiraceae bacterium]|nr:hypothetical protein [Lachnospiraceae bacterium]
MKKQTILSKIKLILCALLLVATTWGYTPIDTYALDFPNLIITFDPADESVIVENVWDKSFDGNIHYAIEGYLNYGKERVETFCYAPSAKSYDIPEKQAYIFNWADREFLLPCSGDYKFTCYPTATYQNNEGVDVKVKGQKITIDITLNKVDESTNWGPGLPNTTVESYDLKQIKGKDKTIVIEEPEYSWNIYGKDIVEVPDANISLKVVTNPEEFAFGGVQQFFGNALAYRLGIEHDGEFGFTATLRYNMGAQYIGQFAHLFYVVGDGTFQFITSTLVDENGYALFPFTHASDYIIAVTDEEYTGQDLNPDAEEPEVIEPEATVPGTEASEAEKPKTDQSETTAPETKVSGNEESETTEIDKDAPEAEESGSTEADKDASTVECPEPTDPVEENSADVSIGIIGSADGPTAILVAGSIGDVILWVAIGIAAVVIATITVVVLVRKKKK